MQLLVDNKNILDAIANRLIEKEKIDGNEMMALIKEINPSLVSDQAIARVKEIVKPVSEKIADAVEAVSDVVSDNGSEGPAFGAG